MYIKFQGLHTLRLTVLIISRTSVIFFSVLMVLIEPRPPSSPRYKVAVTKHKDSEATSSSLYNQNDMWSPAVDFSKFIEDNENIENEVCKT